MSSIQNVKWKLSKREKLIWLAAFFEGEGCVHIRRMKRTNTVTFSVLVTVSQKHKQPLLRFQKMFGGSVNRMGEDAFQWRCLSRQGSAALEQMLPWLEMKKEQAEFAIEFQSKRRQGYDADNTYYEILKGMKVGN